MDEMTNHARKAKATPNIWKRNCCSCNLLKDEFIEKYKQVCNAWMCSVCVKKKFFHC